jgi:predicted ATPase/DNA-binding CsgD family transcriptional regulator
MESNSFEPNMSRSGAKHQQGGFRNGVPASGSPDTAVSGTSGARFPGTVVPSHNLPSRLTSFIGREREIAEAASLLETHRLVTLVGAPGVGKTRLSLQIATAVLETFPDGVWLVELAPLADPMLVPQAVADLLGVREQPGRPLTATLTDWLRSRRLLLLLDNCEHLIGAVAPLAETLLQACPDLHILATSREPLTVEGEVTWRVPSLSVPDTEPRSAAGPASTALLVEAESVRLFVERARAADPAFELSDRRRPVVEQICGRLDGIPLAVELAAAQVRALSVEQIASRLDDRFRLLTGGSRTALPRQQTLRGAVEWSYDLLPEPEQRLLRSLAVFAGGFMLEAIEAHAFPVLEDRRGFPNSSRPGDQDRSPTNVLVSLADKSLVQVDTGEDGERRYRLLETIRQFGLEKLAEHGELEAVRSRHRDYFLAFASEAAPHLTGPGQRTALARLDRELDNLRAALAWCLEEGSGGHGGRASGSLGQPSPDAGLGVRLAAAIWRFWWLRGQYGEGEHWLAQVLASPPSDGSAAGLSARAEVFHGAAQIATHQGHFQAGVEHMEAALALWREAVDDRGVSQALQRLGYYLVHLGDYERAPRLCEESVAIARRLGDPLALATALHSSAMVVFLLCQFQQSVAFSQEAGDLCREIGYIFGIAFTLRHQGRCAAELGDLTRAAQLAQESMEVSRSLGAKRDIAESYKDLGHAALLAGDARQAIEMLHAAISMLRELRDGWLIALCLHDLAAVKTLEGTRVADPHATRHRRPDQAAHRFLEAARLFAAAGTLREMAGIVFPLPYRAASERDLAILREQLGEARFEQAWADGRAMSLEQAVEYAMAITAPTEPAPQEHPPRNPSAESDGRPQSARRTRAEAETEVARLSRRERDVAVLVSRGLTNPQIAEALVLSERTVDTHVHNILGKLELSTRAQVAVWAVRHGLGEAQ